MSVFIGTVKKISRRLNCKWIIFRMSHSIILLWIVTNHGVIAIFSITGMRVIWFAFFSSWGVDRGALNCWKLKLSCSIHWWMVPISIWNGSWIWCSFWRDSKLFAFVDTSWINITNIFYKRRLNGLFRRIQLFGPWYGIL